MPQVIDEVLASEAARIIGCSSQRIRQLVDAGRLPARRGPLGMRFIEREAVERLARERGLKSERNSGGRR
jgi:hypothetical protein